MYEAVLLPTDGSEGTRAAVEHAVDIAKCYEAALHVLYVVDVRLGAGRETPPDAIFDALERHGRTAIDDVIRQAKAASVETIEGVVAQGDPHRAILDYAEDEAIDLVVMGTHGRTGFDHYLLGSVTEKVVRLSTVPVLTVPLSSQVYNGKTR